MLSDNRMRASLQVAPLELTKPRPEETGDGSSSHDRTPKGESHLDTSHLRSQMTPPVTPNGSQEDLPSRPESHMPPVFHNFLRAFYPFHPTLAMADSSVTLPLDEGDVVMVHSIHTNGWADGTLLASGARGWLPTNYCEAYEPEEMRNLLKALLNFWDLLRITTIDEGHMFQSQEFMKGLIGGERTQCLNRESTLIQRCDPLRRCRKSLLSELSSLVKTAKRLQELQRVALDFPDEVNDVVDQMILKAFKIVTKGVRFLDVMDDDKRAYSSSLTIDAMPPVIEETCVPPTPPADRGAFSEQTQTATDDRASAAATVGDAASLTSGETSTIARPVQTYRWSKRLSSLNAPVGANSRRQSQASMMQMKRLSANMAHRLSLAGPSPLSRPHHLVSERLSKSHDKFLSHLGSFIGRLHLQSQSRPELATAIKQSAISGGELLAIVDAVCTQSSSIIGALVSSREALSERIRDLVFAARDTLVNAETEGADIIMPQDNSIMLMSATSCVRAAGECVALTKGVIERTGDFELESDGNALQLDLSVLDTAVTRSRAPSLAERSEAASVANSSHASESISSSIRRPSVVALDKPLPRVPESQPDEESTPQNRSPKNSRPSSAAGEGVSSPASSATSVGRTLPPLPKLTTTSMPVDRQGAADSSTHEQDPHASFDSMAGSSAGSSTTYLSRDSEVSIVSLSSTRATTPDHTLVPRSQPSISELSTTGSSTHTEEADDVESKLLMKTFAHELVFNKEGQVTGGTLPALVERLTTHEATPDATFVSTFYLTFRLFCTPVQLTEALIDRFEYAEESPQTSSPVRLRVYNAFKGWLESHWRDQTDRDALKLIIPFAEARLNAVLPFAGSRLLELAQRVSGEGALVPRLVSSMGRTNTAIGQYVPVDLPLPSPVISKGQQNTLQSFKTGSTSPTILDFEPLELARQLTIRQMNIFCSILPQELLASQWMKKGGANAPNVKAMSSLSTDLSNMVAETILHHTELKKRAAIIKQWIKIAQQFLELHNYDGLMAIICTLNSSTITRLRKTWDAIPQKRRDALRSLQEIVEPSQNNKILRTKLHDHVPPCLPFLGMYLTDLTFVDIGNPATKEVSLGSETEEDGLGGLTVVNFDKHTRTAKIIGELQRFQIPYRLTELPDMQDWLSAQFQRIREGDQGNVQVAYYRKSLLLEPRETLLKREIESPAAAAATLAPSTRTDLFGWMTRDRGGQNSAPSQT
ncbi:guanine nucleotide exchange factor [Trichoderma arundinaceum]|uniref:Guanine nucleotide exchange factor n=1 Tax=Trichoderma arundinaceum TaxID=490622 RepID=A0A395NWY5_TRIAR|nr:guanine nucleotide exchange factor [Trichoderma arundinaceum]